MALVMLDGFSDPFYSQDEESAFEKDLVEGKFWTEEESVALETEIAEIEKMINNAPAIGRRVLFESMFNMEHEIGAPWEFGKDPLNRHWF